MKKFRIGTVLKLLLTVGLLSFLFIKSDLNQMSQLLSSLKISYYLVILLIIFVDVILRSHAWGMLLKVRNISIPLFRLTYIYMVGGFFGVFVPSSVGSDMTRTLMLSTNDSIQTSDSILSVLIMNAMNLLAMCLVASMSALMLFNLIENHLLILAILFFCAFYISIFPFFLKCRIPGLSLLNFPKLNKLQTKLQELILAFRTFGNEKMTLLRVLGIAFLSLGLNIATIYIVSRSLNVMIPLGFLVVLVPVISTGRIMPISIAGLGAEQGIFVYLFHQVGVPTTEALLISLILAFAGLSFNMLGGFVYMVSNLIRLK